MGERLNDLLKVRDELREKIKAMPVAERVRAARLFELFEKALAIEEQGDAASSKLYAAYDEQLFGITTRADALIEGKEAAGAEDFAFWKQHMDPAFTPPAAPDAPAPIACFWRKFIQNCGLYCGEFDDPLLDAIENISIFREEAEEGGKKLVVMRLQFNFRPNAFFSNRELSLRLFKEQDETLLRSRGCAVDWTKNPTVQKEVTKKKNKKTGEVRSFTKDVQKPTLFELFEDFEREEEEAEDEEEQRMTLLGVAEFVDEVEDCLPYALEYFLDLHPDEDGDSEGEEDDEEGEPPEEALAPAQPADPAAAPAPAPAPASGGQPGGDNNCKQQ